MFRIMPCRYSALQATIEGYNRTGIPLVSYNDACNLGESAGYGPAGFTEDLGSYYVIPKMVELFNLNLDVSIQLLYTGTVIISFIIGAIGSWQYCKTRLGKVISVLALTLISIIIAGIGDYYIFLGSTALALVPWGLYIQEHGGIKVHLFYCIAAGLLIGSAHLMRSHSGTGVLLFIFLLILLEKRYSKKLKLALCIIMLASSIVAPMFFKNIERIRINYLKGIGCPYELSGKRIFWHNVYYSLGYLSNPYGIECSDTHSVRKAVSINPQVRLFSPEYEAILRSEVFRIIKSHPFFVINTVFAKFGVLLMYLLIFANFGLLLSIYYPKGFRIELPFIAGIAFNMLFGILTEPLYQYLMGLFAFATLYAICSIDFALHHGVLDRWRHQKGSI